MANIPADKAHQDEAGAEELVDGCRLAYSSVLVSKTQKEAQAFLAHIFTEALTKNPAKKIGGMLFYDEQTSAVVQVLEGPAHAVRSLFHEKISRDRRHTAVKLLWDQPASHRQYEGFGMQLGSDPKTVLEAKGDGELLQLTYVSQMTAPGGDQAYRDIKDILAVAIFTNPKLGIGGALFLNPRTFQVVQALEGPEQNVRSLYSKIAKDTRHTACSVLSEVMVQTRTYDQWGMLQGDLADWSKLTAGQSGMGNVHKRRRGRYAREDLDVEGDDKFVLGAKSDVAVPETSKQADVIKGALQVDAQGATVVSVANE